METTVDKIQFRLTQSREKLVLATILLEKKQYCDSILASYRSIFYAIRVLLVDKDIDSDDPDMIIDIFEKYCDSTVFAYSDIITYAKRSKKLKDYAINNIDTIQYNNAEEMVKIATKILSDVEKFYPH